MILLNNIISRFFILIIQGYRHSLSLLWGRPCRFQPSCSAYGLEAIQTHGPWRGGWLILKRIGRCHPVKALGGSAGYDPVPQGNEEKKNP